MKKFWKLTATAVALSFGLSGLVGCGESGDDNTPSGEIKGNYKEVTADQLSDALASIMGGGNSDGDSSGSGSASGDSSAETPTAYGYKGGFLVKVDFKAGEEKASASLSGTAQTYVDLEAEDSIAANVKADLKADISKGLMTQLEGDFAALKNDISMTAGTEVWINSSYAYISASAEVKGADDLLEEDERKFDTNVKMSMSYIWNMVGGILAEGEEEESGFDIASLLAQAKTMLDITVTADISDNGVKIKAATGDQTATKLKTLLGGLVDDSAMGQIVSALNITKCKGAAYISYSANSNIPAFACDIELAASTTILSQTYSCEISVKANFEETTEKLALPAGIATDSKYELIEEE